MSVVRIVAGLALIAVGSVAFLVGLALVEPTLEWISRRR